MIRRLVLSMALTIAFPLRAQTALPGYSQQAATAERAAETDVISKASPVKASEHSRFLSAQPHMAGTPAQAPTRDYVVAQMQYLGPETEVRAYSVWMPHPNSTRVWRDPPGSV